MIPLLSHPIDMVPSLTKGVVLDGGSVFVCHASYEKRAYGVTSHPLQGLPITHAVVIGTTKSIENNAAYKKCFYDLVSRLTNVSRTRPIPMEVDRLDLIEMIKKFDMALGNNIRGDVANIIIDSSVFPKDRLWVLIDYFRRVKPDIKLFILYAEPESYNTENTNEGWLSKGLKRLIAIHGFNGHQSPEKQTLLVVIVGHEEERMQITIRNTEPDRVLLVSQGTQQYRDAAPRLSDFIIKRLGQDYGHVIDFNEVYSADSRGYLAVKDAILNIFQRHNANFNIVVAANGTKLQSIGALLACREQRAISAIYAEPQIYNPNMSDGIGKIWGLQI